MKKTLSILLALMLTSSSVLAFVYEIPIRTSEEIHKLSDSELSDAYIEAKIEEKASGEFHAGAGFSSAKDYGKRKSLLRYIFDLRREMAKRERINSDELDSYLK